MAERQTFDVRQAWWTGALVLAVALVFGFVILPYARPARSGLVGKAAPDFALKVIVGGEVGNRIRLSNLKGKGVLLDFWASWCEPCQQQSRAIESVSKRFDDKGLVTVGVNTGDKETAAIAAARQQGMTYASVFDEDNVAGKAYGVQALPTVVVVDRNGQIVFAETRVVSERELSEVVMRVLGGA